MLVKGKSRVDKELTELNDLDKPCILMQILSHLIITSQKHAYIMLIPLKSHFYTVKLGFTGLYIIFLISA